MRLIPLQSLITFDRAIQVGWLALGFWLVYGLWTGQIVLLEVDIPSSLGVTLDGHLYIREN